MNTEYYEIMLDEMRKREFSIRQFAKFIGIGYASLIEFFDKSRPFRPLSNRTMAKIHNQVGIPYDIMEEYNEIILKEREK